MMKDYKNFLKPNRFFKQLVVPLTVLLMGVFVNDLEAQCIRSISFGSATISEQTTSPITISTCVFTTEVSTLTVNDPGQYEFTLTSGTDNGYITITDALNNVIDHGPSPHTSSIPSTGTFRVHYAGDALCSSPGGCWVATTVYVGPLSSPIVAVVGSGTLTSGTTQNGSPIYRSATTSAFDFAMSV